MADDDKFSLHIDTDWKKQAQEEKKRLAEQEAKRAQEQQQQRSAGPSLGGMAGLAADVGAPAPGATRGRGRAKGEMPEASFATLVQSTMTQVLYYLGDLAVRGAEPNVNLDMAKHHLDTLGVLEVKTAGNLTADEQHTLDAALYETRMRFVSVASQFMGP
jgi:hypothetical protein